MIKEEIKIFFTSLLKFSKVVNVRVTHIPIKNLEQVNTIIFLEGIILKSASDIPKENNIKGISYDEHSKVFATKC